MKSGYEPTIAVLREHKRDGPTQWSIEVIAGTTSTTLPLDHADVSAMAAVIPVYLVDLVGELRTEQPRVMKLDGMEEAIDDLVLFGDWLPARRPGKPS